MSTFHTRIGFDTSTHNRLVKDGSRSEAIYAGLKSGLYFRFSGLSIEEMIATPDDDQRELLFASCRKLQLGPSDCIYPHNELVRLLVRAYANNPIDFDWKTVNVRALEYEGGIQKRHIIVDSQLSSSQWQSQKEAQKNYKRIFGGMRSQLQDVLVTSGEAPPLTFRQAIARAEGASPNLALGLGKALYDRAAESNVSESLVADFMGRCPPFRALVYAMLMTWYDQCLADRVLSERCRAGRNDLFMAAHLPYVDKFVTAETGREQEKCLREIADACGLQTQIIFYDEFCEGFLVTA